VKLAWASCEDIANPGVAWQRMAAHGVDVFISQGDTPYANSGQAAYGYSTASAVLATTQAQMLDKYRQFWAKEGAQALLARRAQGMLAYYQADDHEWGGDNWDHTLTQANDATSISAADQADVNLHWKRGRDARTQFLAETWDNPTPDAAGNTERPSEALTGGQNPPTTDYPIDYFFRDIGNVRLILLDCISYKSPVAATDNASKRMLGAQQEAWLIDAVQGAAAADHVVISSTKSLYRTTTSYNGDNFGVYGTERNRVLAAVHATGVRPLWLSGDRHAPHVVDARVARGAAADIVDICACPCGVGLNAVGRSFPVSGPRLEWVGFEQVYGLLETGAAGLTAQLRSVRTGSVLWSATFAPRSNVPVYAPQPVAARLG
jgi:hypothetical protein